MAEPRRHTWDWCTPDWVDGAGDTNVTAYCTRPGCDRRWLARDPEPAGCAGIDEEPGP